MTQTSSANVSDLIQAVERADSPARLVAAVRALVDTQSQASIPALIAVLGYNNPEAAVIAVKGLVQLGSAAVPLLIERLDEYNYGARAYSFRALSMIADPRALEILIQAAQTDFAPSVRRAAARGLGYLRWSELPETERQRAQASVLETLFCLTADSEWVIRYAAIVGLQALAIANPDLQPQIILRLNQVAETDSDLAVRARVWMAQQAFSTAVNPSVQPLYSVHT